MKDRATLDSNVLVYSELEPNSDKGIRARFLIDVSAQDGVLAVQALLEFMAVIRRKRPDRLEAASESLDAWSRTFELAPTTAIIANAAVGLARRHGFQIWDAVIWCAARQAGASVFVSEDLQNGLVLDGMTVVNPFALSDDEFTRLIQD